MTDPIVQPVVLDATEGDESSIARRAPIHLVATGIVLPVMANVKV